MVLPAFRIHYNVQALLAVLRFSFFGTVKYIWLEELIDVLRHRETLCTTSTIPVDPCA